MESSKSRKNYQRTAKRAQRWQFFDADLQYLDRFMKMLAFFAGMQSAGLKRLDTFHLHFELTRDSCSSRSTTCQGAFKSHEVKDQRTEILKAVKR